MPDFNISPAIACSSRVRLARNIVDYPFSPVLNSTGRKEIIERISAALENSRYSANTEITNSVYLHSLSERNIVSREFADDCEQHALFSDAEELVNIMVCEEDHLRIQGFAKGLDLESAKQRAFSAEKTISEKVKFAFDSEFGYLAHCPTNLGCGMRASVMMFLPALTMQNRIANVKTQLDKIGIAIRGLYGEGSSADAYMYQISNSSSLGTSEEDIVRKVSAVAIQVAKDENLARSSIFLSNRDCMTDKIMRSLGILKYAHMLSSKDFFECYSYVRLGISLGVINSISYNLLDGLLYSSMPAGIMANSNCEQTASAQLRDKLRAEKIRIALNI